MTLGGLLVGCFLLFQISPELVAIIVGMGLLMLLQFA